MKLNRSIQENIEPTSRRRKKTIQNQRFFSIEYQRLHWIGSFCEW